MTVDRVGVHQSHCCLRHGCKYRMSGVLACPVMDGSVVQDYPCENCQWEQEELPHWLGLATDEQLWAELDKRQKMEGDLVATVPCRKCGRYIFGYGFGSPETGYEHPFSCP